MHFSKASSSEPACAADVHWAANACLWCYACLPTIVGECGDAISRLHMDNMDVSSRGLAAQGCLSFDMRCLKSLRLRLVPMCRSVWCARHQQVQPVHLSKIRVSMHCCCAGRYVPRAILMDLVSTRSLCLAAACHILS